MSLLKGVFISTLTAIAFLAIGSFLLKIFDLSQVTLSGNETQSHIDSMMPLEARGGFTLKEAKVDLSNGLVNLSFKASAKQQGGLYELELETKSKLEYQTDKGQFFLQPQVINIKSVTAQVKLNDIQESFLIEEAREAVKATFNNTPIYLLKTSFKSYLIGEALESVEIKDNSIIAHLSLWQLTVALVTGFSD